MSFTRLYSGQWWGVRLQADEGLSKDYLSLLRLRLRGIDWLWSKLFASNWYWEGKLLVKQLMPACLGGQGPLLYTCRKDQSSRNFCKVPETSADVLANRVTEGKIWDTTVFEKESSGTWKKKSPHFLSSLKSSTPSFSFLDSSTKFLGFF